MANIDVYSNFAFCHFARNQSVDVYLLYNALNTDKLDILAFGDKLNINKIEGETLMSKLFNVYKGKGIVTGNNCTLLNNDSYLGYNTIMIGTDLYTKSPEITKDYLGYQTEFFYKQDNSNGEKLIITLYPLTSQNDIVTIEASHIEYRDSEFSLSNIVYTTNEGEKESASISGDADLIYNGKFYTAYDRSIFNFKNGSIQLIDNNSDGKYDVIQINDYYNIIVDSVSLNDKFVSGKYGNYVDLDIFDVNKMNITDKDGNSVLLEDIKEWDVLSVIINKDNSVVMKLYHLKIFYLRNFSQYIQLHIYDEALELLESFTKVSSIDPMIYYYAGYYYAKSNKIDKGLEFCKLGMNANSDYCFPNRLDDILVLENAIKLNANDSKALYYLGNLWYDRKQSDEATKCWEYSRAIDDTFSIVHRNLALSYYNKQNEPEKARQSLEKAFSLNEKDARIFLELDQLYKKLGVLPSERIVNFDKYIELVDIRDDLYVEYVTILNLLGQYEQAKELISNRKFHPWEGGEGKITAQYVLCHLELGKKYLAENKYEQAIELFNSATIYPHNLGEGKLAGAQENNVFYFVGCAYEGMGDSVRAKEYFEKASVGLDEPTSAMFYNDQPPEMIFYQGLSLIKLGQTERAMGKFNKLLDYGEKHIFDNITIDYFAISLPDFLIFNEDLNKNVIHCRYLIGLGNYGFNRLEQAEKEFKLALELDANHLGVSVHLNMLTEGIR